MKKILILIMSCNKEHFINEERVCKDTYLSILPDNIDYIIYRGGGNNTYLDKENNLLGLDCNDSIEFTFQKTYLALKYINSHFDYDYIFRTNTSTYVNIELLNYFVNRIENVKDLWGAEYTRLVDVQNKLFKNPYLRGNGLLLSRFNVEVLLNEGKSIGEIKTNAKLSFIDDEVIGAVINGYWETINNNYYDSHIKVYKECWYKSICTGSYPTSVSDMNNSCLDFDYLKQFMVIQIRNWYDRSVEEKHFYEVHKVFVDNKNNELEKTFNEIFEYTKNPDVFLGSSYGFILYDKLFNSKKE